MVLFQIAEPGQSTAPHEHKLAVGIDLGTTNSLVATVRSGIAVVINDDQGRPLLPSIVRYHANGATDVGYDAQTKLGVDPRNTIVSVKRFMGRGLKDVSHVIDALRLRRGAGDGQGQDRGREQEPRRNLC